MTDTSHCCSFGFVCGTCTKDSCNFIGCAACDCDCCSAALEPPATPLIDVEQIEYMQLKAYPLMQKPTASGEMTFNEEVTVGYTHDAGLNSKYFAEVSAETGPLAELASGKLQGTLRTEVAASYNFQFSRSSKTTRNFVMPEGSPGYVYQSNVYARTNKGRHLDWSGGLLMTAEPLHLLEEKNFAVMNPLGQGFCTSGYYAGWDRRGVESHADCIKVCLDEPECTFAAFSPGRTCSRYNEASCTLNSDRTYATYSKQFY